MKRKIVVGILVIILIALGVLAYLFINSIKEDQAITAEKAKKIVSSYEKFDKSINDFASLRETIYKKREETFLEDFAKTVDEWNKRAKDYEAAIEAVEKNSEFLKKNCNVRFADVNVNGKCTTFKANYEAAVNYYLNDVESYNKMAKQYNDWVTNNKYSYGKLNDLSKTIYKDYIDVDEDGEFFGKGEEVESVKEEKASDSKGEQTDDKQ